MYTITLVEKMLRQHKETMTRISLLEILLCEPERGIFTRLPNENESADDRIGGSRGDIASFRSDTMICSELLTLRTQVKLVDAWLTLLNPEERLVIETHTIGGLDWARTIVEHEQKWGREQGRSDRTLKRIQANAIRKIWRATNMWVYDQKPD